MSGKEEKKEAEEKGKPMKKKQSLTKKRVSVKLDLKRGGEEPIGEGEEMEEESQEATEVEEDSSQWDPDANKEAKEEEKVEDEQMNFIENFRIDLDEDVDKVDNSSLNTYQVQRLLYLKECKKHNVLPIRAMVNVNEDTHHLNGNHIHMGTKGAEALAVPLHLNTSINVLDIGFNDIGPYGCQCIAEVFIDNKSLQTVNLSYNDIGSHGLSCICRSFKTNIFITNLDLSGNFLGDKNTTYVAYILQHPFLIKLRLANNGFELNTAKCIGYEVAQNETMEILDISWNHFRFKGAELIAKGIKDNTHLLKLDVSFNGFGANGIAAMVKALTANQTLQELDISYNRITDLCIPPLCTLFKKNSSLRHLKIGGNPLTGLAAVSILQAIKKASTCGLVSLDLHEVFIDQEFLDFVSQIQETKSSFTTPGCIWELRLIESKLKEAKQKMELLIASANLKNQKPHPLLMLNSIFEDENALDERMECEGKEDEELVPETQELSTEMPTESQLSENMTLDAPSPDSEKQKKRSSSVKFGGSEEALEISESGANEPNS